MEDLNEGCVKLSRLFLLNFPSNRPSKSVTVGKGPVIVLNDSANPRMVINIYFNFSDFFKVLELF